MPKHTEILISTEQYAAGLPYEDILLVHISSAETYKHGHIPNAILVTPNELLRGEKPALGKLPTVTQLNTLFSRLGLTENTYVLAYDDEGGGWAGRFLWTLDIIGHQAYGYLDGGLPAWQAQQYEMHSELSPTVTERTAVNFETQLNLSALASAEHILSRLKDDDFCIWDARSQEEYDGRKILSKQGGHIPGAVWLEWFDLMDTDRDLKLRDLGDLINKLESLGLTADKEIVTHCHGHHRSGLTYLVARILGYPRIKAYDGSWSEWGNDSSKPAEQ